MPYKDLIKYWHEGVLEADKKNYDSSLKNFGNIDDPPAKIWFNIGCIHLLKGELEQSLEAYNKSVIRDPCLAVGYFQRSYVNYKLQRYEKALCDCHHSLAQLRNNKVIDYKQLGLHYLLYSWEILYNTAVILCYLGRWENAHDKLKEATGCLPGEARNCKIEAMMDAVQNHVFLQPAHVPQGELFKPKKEEVEQIKYKDFLGKPKVISSVVPNDQYSGFEPLRPQKPGFYEPCPEAILGQDAGYHRVLVHYYPENSNEVSVKANTILFVLNKDGDWATGIHDGQKIYIPTNVLEPVNNTPKADIKKVVNGIPMPPMKTPPTRPKVTPIREHRGNLIFPEGIPPRPDGKPPEPHMLNNVLPRKGFEEISAFSTADPVLVESDFPRTGPVVESPTSHMLYPVVEIDVTLLEKAMPLKSDPLVERTVPLTTGPAVERALPPTTGPAVERVTLKNNPTLEKDVHKKTNPVDERAVPLRTEPDGKRNVFLGSDSAGDYSFPQKTDPVMEQDVFLQSGLGTNQNSEKVTQSTVPPPAEDKEITLQIHTEFTVSLKIHKDIAYTELQDLLRDKIRQQGEQMKIQLSYRGAAGSSVTPVRGDRELQSILKQAPTKRLTLHCKDANYCLGRRILYSMKAIYEYPAEGPEDLTFIVGDIIDILSEVNEEWLEGHCNGKIGIFPKCFATRFEDD
ncbi:NADPH oxidase activator 1 [Pelobates cultripes]|uniref:NADPH oxidase activator 1 n=1 Tax=Pelobates cultripes TaxID=61616 RepID=A0AAD1WQD1_PELCU|nr:NADPH oxidase activator 1 [Pelobates cultripes]